MPDSAPALSLSAVPPGEYQQFADGLRDFLPHSYQIEAMLRSHLKYNNLDILNATLYAPADETRRLHLALISPSGSTREMNSFTIYWDERHLSDDDVCQLLRTLPVDSWKNPFMVRQIPLHLQPKMDKMMLKLSDGELHLLRSIRLVALTVNPSDLPPVPKLPDGYHFGQLDGSHGEEVRMPWAAAHTETATGMSKYLDKLPSASVFYKKHMDGSLDSTQGCSAENNHLASYVLFKYSADLGVTHTKEDHRRKGLARAVTLRLAHRIHGDGLPVTAIIEHDLESSIQMHTSMGFKYYTDVAISFYFPKHFKFNILSSFSNFEMRFPDSMEKWREAHMAE